MTKIYGVLIVILFLCGSLISQEKDPKKINDAKILLLEEKLKVLEDRNNFYSNVIQSVAVVNSSWANYFTLISIFIGAATLMIPIAGYFIVIKPTRELKKKVKSLDRVILESVEKNFAIYIEKYEESRIKRAIEMLFDSNTRVSAIDILFLCDNKNIDENGIKRIVEFLSQDIELEDMHSFILHSKLLGVDSIYCEKYFKQILESERIKNRQFAIDYFAHSDIEKHLNYLEKILTSSEIGFDLLILILQKMEEEYFGDIFSRNKTSQSIEKGKQKIAILLNSKVLTEKLNVRTKPRDIMDNFFININRLNRYPFYRETLFHTTHFANIEED